MNDTHFLANVQHTHKIKANQANERKQNMVVAFTISNWCKCRQIELQQLEHTKRYIAEPFSLFTKLIASILKLVSIVRLSQKPPKTHTHSLCTFKTHLICTFSCVPNKRNTHSQSLNNELNGYVKVSEPKPTSQRLRAELISVYLGENYLIASKKKKHCCSGCLESDSSYR